MKSEHDFRMVVLAAVMGIVLGGMGLAQNVASSESRQTEKVYQAQGRGITPPKLLKHVEPGFSEEARKERIQGTAILSFIVGLDGIPRDIKVVRAPGHGLDRKAVEAVQQWRFEPGRKDGEPVLVELMVEINFHLR